MNISTSTRDQWPQITVIPLRWACVKVYGRSKGYCERCSLQRGTEYHHRRPRGMGGSKDPLQHSPANLVNLCLECHRWVEAHSAEAYEAGWKVRHGRDEPVEVPIVRRDRTLWLAHDGTLVSKVTKPEGRKRK